MKRIGIIISGVILSIATFAQTHTLSGKVSTDDGEALAGASIIIEGTVFGTMSGTDGSYSLKVPEGSYTFVCSFIGYTSRIETLDVNADIHIDFILEETGIVADAVVVTAIKANETTPVAQTNIDKETIASNAVAADIPFQLEMTPSVVASSENGTGMGYTSMRIRGTDMTRINVSVNGIPLNDAESQGVFWVNMPDFTSSVESIQIQRGVGTSTNGAAAFGASINFQTTGIEDKPYGELSTTVGSYNTFKRNVSAGTGLLHDHFTLDLRYSKLDSDGWIQRGYSDHESFYMSGAYVDSTNLLRATILTGEEHTGITWWGVPDDMMDIDRTYNPAGKYTDSLGNDAFYDGQSDNYWQNHYQLHYTKKLSRYLNANVALHLTEGEGYYEQYIPEYDDWGSGNYFADYGMSDVTIGDTTVSTTDMIRQKRMKNIFYGYTFSANYKKDRLEASVGSSWNKYDGDHYGLVKWTAVNNGSELDYEWYNNNGTKTDLMFFAKLQYQILEGVYVYGDMQYRRINYILSGIDDDLATLDSEYDWDFINPKAGVFYKLNKHNELYASYANASREPARSDLKEAAKDTGAAAPRPETLHDFEIGYQWKKQKAGIGINLFYMLYDDQLVNTGELSDVGYAIMTNVENSYRRGIEISGGIAPHRMVKWDANIALSQNKITDYSETVDFYDADWNYLDTRDTAYGTTDISFSPSVVASSIIAFSPFKNLTISFISKYVGKQYIDNTSSDDRSLDPYLVNNIGIGYSFPVKNIKAIELQLLVNNIFNAEYSSSAYGGYDFVDGEAVSWIYYYPQAPTNIMCKATVKF